jgi:hypothetical protein
VNLEFILLDDRTRPDTCHELVLGDELTSRLNQHREDLERAAPQGNRDSPRPQFTPLEIHLPSVQLVYQVSTPFPRMRVSSMNPSRYDLHRDEHDEPISK